MRVKISKMGNDVAVRLPKEIAERHGIVPGMEVDVICSPQLVRLATEEPKVTIESLIAQCQAYLDNGGTPPETVDWGPDVGSERIDD